MLFIYFYGISSGGLLYPYIIEFLPPIGLTVIGLGQYLLAIFIAKYCVYFIPFFGLINVLLFFSFMSFIGAFVLFGIGVETGSKKEIEILFEYRDKKFEYFVKGFFDFENLKTFFLNLSFLCLKRDFLFLIATFFIANYTEIDQIIIFGISNCFLKFFFFIFLSGIGKLIKNKLYQYKLERNYEKINRIFWKSLFLFSILLIFLFLTIFISYFWLFNIGIKKNLVESIFFFLLKSIPYLILEGINYIFYKFISSLEKNILLKTTKFLNLFTFLFLSFIFIIIFDKKATGFIYAKFFEELIIFFITIYFIKNKIKNFIYETPTFEIIKRNIFSPISKIIKNILKNFRNLLTIEINTYCAILLLNSKKLVIWIILINCQLIFLKLGKIFSNSLKKILEKEIIKNGIKSAYNKSIIILLYSFFLSFFFFYFLSSKSFFLANFFSQDEKIIFILQKCFQIYSLNIFSEFIFESVDFLMKFNNFENAYFWIKEVFYPLTCFLFSPTLCFFFNLQIEGLVLSISFAKFINVSLSLIILFYFFKWKKKIIKSSKDIEMTLL